MMPERKRLTMPEYQALLKLTGGYTAVHEAIEILHDRINMNKNGYFFAKGALKALFKTMDAIFRTIPADKLSSIKRDFNNVYTITKITNSGAQEEDAWRYVNAHAMDDVVDKAMAYECYTCGKTGSELRKCEFRNAVNQLYPCDIAVQVDGECSLCGSTGYKAINDICKGRVEADEEEGDD